MMKKNFCQRALLIHRYARTVLLCLGMLLMLIAGVDGQQRSTANGKPPMSPLEFKSKLKGPIFSFPTPFNENLEINYKGIGEMIERALRYECKVVTLTSGNSKYDRLSYAEVREMTRYVVESVGNRAVVISSAGTWDREQIKDYARYAEYMGASAVQVALPLDLQNSESIPDIVAFYKEIAESTSLGIVLHGLYSIDLLNELIKINSIVAMKEDVDFPYYITRQILFKDRLAIFGGGNDARYLHGYPYGSPAYYSSLYTYAPEIGLKFWQAIQKNDMKAAAEIVLKYDLPFIDAFTWPLWSSAIEYFGGPTTYIRPKSETLSQPEFKKMRELFAKMELVPALKTAVTAKRGLSLPDDRVRGGHIGGMINGKLLIAGGNNWSKDKKNKYWLKDAMLFDDDRWMEGPSLPTPVAYAMYAHDGSGIYYAGGTTDGTSASREVYRLQSVEKSAKWEELPKLPHGIHSGGAAILKGKFYVCAGNTGSDDSDKMYVLDLNDKKSQWRECRSLPGPRRILTSLVAAGNFLYLLGGLSNGASLGDAYRYDPASNQWTKLNDLAIKGYAWASAPIDDNSLLLTGKADESKPLGIHAGIWVIDLKDMAVRKAGELIEASTTSPLIKTKDKQWWFVAGEPDSNRNRTGVVSIIELEKNK